MIIKNTKRELPTDWTTTGIVELLDHATDLAANGNPAGLFVIIGLTKNRTVYPTTDTDYADCRTWIEGHADLVRSAWQYEVRAAP